MLSNFKALHKEKFCWDDNGCIFSPLNNGMAQMEDMSCQSPQKISDGNDSSDDPLCSKKFVNFMKQYWQENISKAAKEAQLTCVECPKYNTGKSIQTSPGHFDFLV